MAVHPDRRYREMAWYSPAWTAGPLSLSRQHGNAFVPGWLHLRAAPTLRSHTAIEYHMLLHVCGIQVLDSCLPADADADALYTQSHLAIEALVGHVCPGLTLPRYSMALQEDDHS